MADGAFTQGFNKTEIAALLNELEAQETLLAQKSTILADIEAEVAKTWKGPDADKYLDELFAYYNETLLPEVQKAFSGIHETISNIEEQWINFQNSGAQ